MAFPAGQPVRTVPRLPFKSVSIVSVPKAETFQAWLDVQTGAFRPAPLLVGFVLAVPEAPLWTTKRSLLDLERLPEGGAFK